MPNRVALLLGLLSAVALPLLAQEHRRFEPVRNATGSDRFSVYALAQSPDGLLWLGTDEGLVSYDGQESWWLRRSQVSGLGSNRISSLLTTKDGTVWVGTRGGGLSRFDPETATFTHFAHDPEDPTSLSENDVMALAMDSDGFLWVATARVGLNRLDPRAATPAFERWLHDESLPTSLSDDRVRTLHLDSQGTLWVGTMGGINRLRAGATGFDRFQHDPARASSLPDDEVWSLWVDRDGDLWIGMWGGGLSRLRQAHQATPTDPIETFTTDPGVSAEAWSLRDARVMELFEDTRGTLWVGTQGGLHELLEEERRSDNPRFLFHGPRRHASNALLSEDVHAFLEDPRGDLWIATNGGVHRIDRRFESIEVFRLDDDPSTSDLSAEPNGITVDDQDRYWVSTTGYLDRIQRRTNRFENHRRRSIAIRRTDDPDRPALLHSPTFTANGDLWLASHDGVFRFPRSQLDQDQPAFERYIEGLSSAAVLDLFEDSAGTLWIGTYRGLHRAVRDPEGAIVSFVDYLHDPEDSTTLSSLSASRLAEGPPGTLWIGTYKGLNRLDVATGEIEHLYAGSRATSLRNDFIQSLLFEAPSTLWIGTWGGGLHRLDVHSGSLGLLDTSIGLPSDAVGEVFPAANGALWVGSSNHLTWLDPATGRVERLDASQGLQSMTDITLAGADQDLAVITPTEITLIPRDGFPLPDQPPTVRLTGLRLRNDLVPIDPDGILPRALSATTQLNLDYQDVLIAFEFGSIDFRRARQIEYRYRLAGLAEDWIQTDSSDRKATYTHLPPGNYQFQVMARYPGGPWNATPATIGLSIAPPWWGTWWARTLLMTTLITLAVSWPLRRYRQTQRRAAELEERVAERTEELQTANRQLEQMARSDFLTGISNRRRFIERAQEALVSRRRTGRPLSLALGDLDDFKAINDQYGHDRGDAVLVEVASILNRTIRDTDLVARWGGEEFVVLFYDCDLEGAVRATEALREAIEGAALNLPRPVTMTFGVTQIGLEDDLETATAAADQALYDGKRAGKNRCIAVA